MDDPTSSSGRATASQHLTGRSPIRAKRNVALSFGLEGLIDVDVHRSSTCTAILEDDDSITRRPMPSRTARRPPPPRSRSDGTAWGASSRRVSAVIRAGPSRCARPIRPIDFDPEVMQGSRARDTLRRSSRQVMRWSGESRPPDDLHEARVMAMADDVNGDQYGARRIHDGCRDRDRVRPSEKCGLLPRPIENPSVE